MFYLKRVGDEVQIFYSYLQKIVADESTCVDFDTHSPSSQILVILQSASALQQSNVSSLHKKQIWPQK